jgi:hypothetical protein
VLTSGNAPTETTGVTLVLGGQSLTTTWWDANLPQGTTKTVLLQDQNGRNLISKWTVGSNTVLHIAADFPTNGTTSAFCNTLMSDILSYAGVTAAAQYISDWNLETYQVPGGNAMVAWNTTQLTSQDANKLWYQAPISPAESITLLVQPSTQYNVYSVFEGTTAASGSTPATITYSTPTSLANGQLTITLDKSPSIIYYGPASSSTFSTTMYNAGQAYGTFLEYKR